jgi:NTP pyrophosphatase (non-canonical NTP hydrolase)
MSWLGIDPVTITALVKDSHERAKAKGWWAEESFNLPEKLALIHSEVSEALEEYRNDREPIYIVSGKPEGIAIELADVVIRVADLCGRMGIDLEEAIRLKSTYNETRPHRHGGKKA